jgi:hypothetical protein
MWQKSRPVGMALLLLGSACRATPAATPAATPVTTPLPLPSDVTRLDPSQLQGAFLDDYGNRFRISDTLWEQLPHGRFHIVEWHAAQQFFVAQNDAANSADANLWTRIDWMPLTGMAPYTWAFCMTAYQAPTRDSARNTTAPNRDVPRTGCNGYPFSRMRLPTP